MAIEKLVSRAPLVATCVGSTALSDRTDKSHVEAKHSISLIVEMSNPSTLLEIQNGSDCDLGTVEHR